MPDETAMMLTQEEWDDLAAMVETYKDATKYIESTRELAQRLIPDECEATLRRRALADRIIEANS